MTGTPRLDPVAFGDLLRRQRLAAGLTQEALAERAGLSVRGISDLERGIHAHPQRETVRMLVEALGVDGPTRAALLAATQRPPVADRRQPAEPPATDLLGSPTVRLPVFPGTFVGRQNELAACQALLTKDGAPLLTLTGPGGTGKTRLAVAIAAAVGDAFPHGVSFIDLARLRETSQVLPLIAASLGARERGDEPVRGTLARFLAGQRVMLVLDNCEHLLGAAPEIAALLAACPDLTVLATSREPLRVRSEQVFPVPPLPLPAGPATTWAELLRVPSVALFVERARAGDPAFPITDQNAAIIAAICQRLDGLPLAIELAAARIRAFPPAALLTRLDHRLPLLTGGARDLPVRQQTLRDAIAWSYDLLTPAEQALCRHLAVFVGGCTLEAAEQATNLDEDLSIMDALGSLVDKSLVRVVAGAGGEPRYTMLETIREFAQERLVESREEEDVRGHHAAYFQDFGERGGTALHDWDRGDATWVARLAADHDNVLAALAWSLTHGGESLRLAERLWMFWYHHSDLIEGRRWLEAALAADAAQGLPAAPEVRAEALFGCGVLAQVQGLAEAAAASFAESVACWEAAGHALESASTRSMLGGVLISQGRYPEAAALFAKALEELRALGDEFWVGRALFHLGLVAYADGDRVLARAQCAEAVALYRKAGGSWFTIDPLGYLGLIACADGAYAEAAAIYGDILTRLRTRGGPSDVAVALAGVATLAVARGADEQAARLFGAAEAQRDAAGGPFPLPARDTFVRAGAEGHARMGEAAWIAAHATGRSLTPEAAFVLADAVLTEAAAAPSILTSPSPNTTLNPPPMPANPR